MDVIESVASGQDHSDNSTEIGNGDVELDEVDDVQSEAHGREVVPSHQEIVSNMIVSTIQQSTKSIEILSKSAAVLDAALENATFDQRLQAMAAADRLVSTTSDAIRSATNMYLALGIRVNCDMEINISSLIPRAFQPARVASQPGFEADMSLPSASKYSLTLSLTKQVDVHPRELLDLLLRGSGCQVVARTVGNDFVTVRFESKSQLTHAVDILNAASYQGTPVISFCSIASTTKSAYAIRSFPVSRSNLGPWFNEQQRIRIDIAINALNRDNSGWFPSNDVESIESYPIKSPAGQKDKKDFVILKVFISMPSYRHFLRSSHDITNVDCNGHLVKFKEEVIIIQCWNCCQFGHYSNQCANSFKCRYCISDHAKNATCSSKDAPTCRNCSANNQALEAKQKVGDSSHGVDNFRDWRLSPVDHFATSSSCRVVQMVKATHLQRLKHAAFSNLPLPPFVFP